MNRIEYSINGGESKVYDKGIFLSKEGVHTISYIGFDNVENTSSSVITVKVDNTGPSINHLFSTSPVDISGDKKAYPKYVTLFLSGTDNVIGLQTIKYSFNNGTKKAYTIPITGFSAGEKTMNFIATDKLGNITEQEIKFEIRE